MQFSKRLFRHIYVQLSSFLPVILRKIQHWSIKLDAQSHRMALCSWSLWMKVEFFLKITIRVISMWVHFKYNKICDVFTSKSPKVQFTFNKSRWTLLLLSEKRIHKVNKETDLLWIHCLFVFWILICVVFVGSIKLQNVVHNEKYE